MSTTENTARGRRLVLAVDPSGSRQDLLETAFDLAQKLGADVAVRFISDPDWRAIAGFPTTRTISASGTLRNFTPEDMERALRRTLQHMHQQLQTLAGRYGVHLEIGEALLETLEQWQASSASADLAAIVGPDRPHLSASAFFRSVQQAAQWTSCRMAVIRARPQRGRPVFVEAAGSPAVLDVAAQLAAAYGADIVLAVSGDKATQQAALTALPETQRGRTRLVVLEKQEQVLQALGDYAPALVVLDRQGAFAHSAQVQALADQLRCPVFLIG